MSTLACNCFHEPNHNFQQHVQCTLTEQMRKQMTIVKTGKHLLKQEHFWIPKLKTFYPDALNQEFNAID